MALTKPAQLTTAFAHAGLKNDIPQATTGSNLASFEEGFPRVTMQAIADGGMPPQGQDFNGMFYTLTDIARYAQAGGLYPFDKEFCTAIGGYPLGAILTSLDGAKLYKNTVNGNTNDPNSNTNGWKTFLTADQIDAIPTDGSGNPVASNGVFDALATKQNTLTFDNAPTSGSTNPVTSGGIKTALDAKQDTLTFDSTPTADSNNPVTSQGIKAAIDAKDSLPSQTGHAGEYLKTDGETASWSNVESLPSQTGNAGKVLTTDGTTASWQPAQTRNVGEYAWSALPLTDAGLHLLDGSLLPSGGVYDGFVQYINSLFVSQNPSPKWLPKEQIVLPTFTSNTQDGITISDARGNTTDLQNIFNGTTESVQIGQWTTYWINIDYAQNTLLSSYTIQADNAGAPEYPSAWVVNGSNDGETWEQIDSQSGITFALNESKTFTVNPDKVYKQYRIVFSDGVLAKNSGEIRKISFDAYSAIYGYENGLFLTEEQWQDCVAKYGSCSKFVYTSGTGVRLPKVSDILQGTTDVTAVGDLIEAGLPNIKGEARASRWINNEQIPLASGAFQWKDGYSDLGGAQNATYNTRALTFDASLSSPIYGKSTTVQPQTIKALLYICVANSVKTQIQVDIDNIATDLNSKANRDLSNVVGDAVERVVEQGENYIRYSSGKQICWGSGKAKNSFVKVTLPKAFKDTNYSVAVAASSRVNASGVPDSATAVSVGTTNQEVTNIRFICVGLWK